MSSKSTLPDYELVDEIVITAPAQLRAIADPLRGHRRYKALLERMKL